MERVRNVHVRHDLVGSLDQVIRHLVGFDFDQTKICLRVNQSWIDGHSVRLDHTRIGRSFH